MNLKNVQSIVKDSIVNNICYNFIDNLAYVNVESPILRVIKYSIKRADISFHITTFLLDNFKMEFNDD